MKQPFTALAFLLLASLLPAQKEAPKVEGKKLAPPLLSKVVIIGASLSNGFSNGLKLASAIEPGIAIEHKRVRDCSTSAFFMNPRRFGKQLMGRALKREPSLIIALDFVFWYAYGRVYPRDLPDNTGLRPSKETLAKQSLAMRLAKFELGLAQLDRYKGPLVLAEIPDMTGADARILSRSQIPTKPELRALNERLSKWVAARRKKGMNTMVFPLARLVEKMKSNKFMLPATPDGKQAARPLDGKVLMAWDNLHPSKVGVVLLVGELFQAMEGHFGKELAGQVEYDLWKEFEKRRVLQKLIPGK